MDEFDELQNNIKGIKQIVRIQKIKEICREFEMVWKHCPDLRFGQMISKVVNNGDSFYTTDEEFLNKLYDIIEEGYVKFND